MNKIISLIISLCTLVLPSFSVEPIKSLEQLAFESIINSKTWSQKKEQFKLDFKNGKYNIHTFFRNKIIKKYKIFKYIKT